MQQVNKKNVRMWIYVIVICISFIALILSARFVSDNTAGFITIFSLTGVIVAMIVAMFVEDFIVFKHDMNEIKNARKELAMLKRKIDAYKNGRNNVE